MLEKKNNSTRCWPGRAAALALLAVLVWCAPAAGDAPPVGRRLAVVVGVGSFSDWSLPNLDTARADAELVAKWLADPAGGGFRPADITLLVDKAATRAAIKAAMDRLVAEARPEDLVFIYVSSHGFFTKGSVLGIVCHDSVATGDTGPRGPLVVGGTTVTRDDLRRFFLVLGARRRAAVVDVCYGEAAVDHLPLNGPHHPRAGGHISFDGPPRTLASPDYATMVLVSSQKGQRSWESSELGSSIFTHYLLEGLRQNHGSLRRAFEHARSLTARRARQEKGMVQMPYLIAVPGYADIVLGGGGPDKKKQAAGRADQRRGE